ncbi:MAG: DUF7793 family protein [Bacteroidia bacterium]
MKRIQTRTSEYSVIEKPVFLCRLLPDTEVDVEDVDKNTDAVMEMAGGERYAVLVDARVPVQITAKAMEHAQQPRSYINLIAQAILVNSLANRLIGNFIIKFHRPASPTRLFSDYDAALNWLKEQVAKDKGPEKDRQSNSVDQFTFL